MDELNIRKRIYTYLILIAIYFISWYVVSRITDTNISLWILIPLAVVLAVIGWRIMRPIRKELKKGGKTKEKLEASLFKVSIMVYSIMSYIFGIIFLIAGLFFIVLVIAANLIAKNMSSLETLLFTGIGLVLLIVGVMALFAGKGLSKRKKWGRNLATIVLIFFVLFFLLVIILGDLFGTVTGAIIGIILIIIFVFVFSMTIYELYSKYKLLWKD